MQQNRATSTKARGRRRERLTHQKEEMRCEARHKQTPARCRSLRRRPLVWGQSRNGAGEGQSLLGSVVVEVGRSYRGCC